MEVKGQIGTPTNLIFGKEAKVTVGWAPGPVWKLWRIRKSLAPTGNGTPAVQPDTN
jgi:hypothetical protein